MAVNIIGIRKTQVLVEGVLLKKDMYRTENHHIFEYF